MVKTQLKNNIGSFSQPSKPYRTFFSKHVIIFELWHTFVLWEWMIFYFHKGIYVICKLRHFKILAESPKLRNSSSMALFLVLNIKKTYLELSVQNLSGSVRQGCLHLTGEIHKCYV